MPVAPCFEMPKQPRQKVVNLTRGRDKNLRCGLILQAFQVAYVVFYPEIMGCNSK